MRGLINMASKIRAASRPNEAIEIERVLEEVQKALLKIDSETKNENLPSLDSISLTLETTVTKTEGGKFKILIFTFGKTYTKESAQSIQVKLTPPPASALMYVAEGPSLADQLAEAII